ncbi:hypothetical protein EY04_24075 [Pseudomonas chlororaphis]|nr:hypothetical protein EY04_24075 [Pseudomonas chlororaphis]
MGFLMFFKRPNPCCLKPRTQKEEIQDALIMDFLRRGPWLYRGKLTANRELPEPSREPVFSPLTALTYRRCPGRA